MATSKEFVDHVVDQVRLGSRLKCRKMFGEYGIYLDDKFIAMACDNSLFLKPTAAVARLAPGLPQRPPYPGAKDHPVVDELLDEGDRLRALLLASLAELPARKARPSRAAGNRRA